MLECFCLSSLFDCFQVTSLQTCRCLMPAKVGAKNRWLNSSVFHDILSSYWMKIDGWLDSLIM